MEIDIIYPCENFRTRNSWLPIIFAIQGAETAYFNGFTVSWTLYHTVRTQDDDYNWESLASYKDAVDYEDFHYGNLGDDIAMVMNVGGHALPIDLGRYNFTWEFNMVPCTRGDLGDLDEWLGECPELGAQVTITDSVLLACAVLAEEGEEISPPVPEPEPCRTALRDEQQRECIRGYFSGLTSNGREYLMDNATEACMQGFDVLPENWTDPYRMSSSTSSSYTRSTSTTTISASSTSDAELTATATPTPTGIEGDDEGGSEDEAQAEGDGGSSADAHVLNLQGLGCCMIMSLFVMYFA
ncbi:hypothetical protein BJX66DRAFT_345157 [Aspergillus keveii]|uniref:DUF7136 domain-containing protein n=1 Tax=Aspergillus keveii TaxID=714993 RepID=A0ABR4FIX5_9EURO